MGFPNGGQRQTQTPSTPCRQAARPGSILSLAIHEDRSALARESGVNLWWPGAAGFGQNRSRPARVPTRGFSVLVTPFQPSSFNNLAGSLPDYCTTVPNRAPLIHAKFTQNSRREYRKNKPLITSKPTYKIPTTKILLQRDGYPFSAHLLFDAPAAGPSAHSITHLAPDQSPPRRHCPGRAPLLASSLCSIDRPSLAGRPWLLRWLANRWRRRACSFGDESLTRSEPLPSR